MFYRRIFGMNWMIWATLLISYGWCIASMIAAICSCEPISYFWNEIIDPTAGSYRYNFYYYYVGNAAANVVTDVLILLVPIPVIWNLQMRTTQKIGVCGVLLLGGLYVLQTNLFQKVNTNTTLSQCLRRKRYSHPLHHLPPQQHRYHMGLRQCSRVVNHRAVHRNHLRLSPCPTAIHPLTGQESAKLTHSAYWDVSNAQCYTQNISPQTSEKQVRYKIENMSYALRRLRRRSGSSYLDEDSSGDRNRSKRDVWWGAES